MTELHQFLRDLDDPDDFSTLPASLTAAGSASSSLSAKVERAPKVYGFDTREFSRTLPAMLQRVREAVESETHPLGRSARQWASSGFSRVPGSHNNSSNSNNRGSLSSASASAKLSPFRARAPSTDSLSLDSRSSEDTLSQQAQSHTHTLSLNPMREKLSLSLFLHEVSKLLLNTQEINAQYCKMKEELVSFSPREILSLAYENTVISLFRNHDVFDNVENARNNAFLYHTQRNEAIAREYEALREDAVRRFVSFQEAHRCDILNDLFLYDDNNDSDASFEQYVEEHSEIICLYGELFAPSSAAATAGHGEKKTGTHTHNNNKTAVRVELSRVFFFSWLWNVKIVLVSLARQRRCLLPSAPMNNRFSASANNNNNNNKLVSNNINNRRASASSSTADPSAIHSEMEAAFINAKYLFSLARFYNMNATRVIRNAREYDDLLAHYHGHYFNNNNGINNSNNNNEKSGNNDASNNNSISATAIVHAKFTRSYGSTPLLETETITVHETPLSQSPTHTQTQTQTVYRRSLSLFFDERRKKNDPNTSVFCDETNAWMSLCQRFQRENVPIGLFRNILTSKKLSLSYYSTNEYVLQGLFKIFLVECVKNPSYLLLHAMVMDLIEGMPSANNNNNNGAASCTPSPRSSFSAAGAPPTVFTGRTSTIPTYLANNNGNGGNLRGSFTGGSARSPSTGSGASGGSAGNAGPWSWARLVPRRKIDNSGSCNASASAASSPVPAFSRSVGIADNNAHNNCTPANNISINNNNNILSMHTHAGMRDYQLDDVLLPAAVEGADDANQELLAIYNLFSSMPYFYDQISQCPPSLAESTAASETLSAANVKWMLLDKEFHILSAWLNFRAGIDIAKSASASANADATSSSDSSPSSPADSAAAFTLPEDPQQLSAWLWKTLFPRLVDLLSRWYGVNILETFDHLREPAGM